MPMNSITTRVIEVQILGKSRLKRQRHGAVLLNCLNQLGENSDVSGDGLADRLRGHTRSYPTPTAPASPRIEVDGKPLQFHAN